MGLVERVVDGSSIELGEHVFFAVKQVELRDEKLFIVDDFEFEVVGLFLFVHDCVDDNNQYYSYTKHPYYYSHTANMPNVLL